MIYAAAWRGGVELWACSISFEVSREPFADVVTGSSSITITWGVEEQVATQRRMGRS